MDFTKIKSNPSQKIVPIKEIRDGVVVLKDDSLRMIIMASSTNFALKSDDEQKAIIMQFQNFLNSLDFPLQTFIQSRNLNIEPYIETLRIRAEEETNELLKIQIKEYMDFIKEFVADTRIVTKTFYLVVPYQAGFISREKSVKSILGNFLSLIKKPQKKESLEEEKFQEYKLQLQQRGETIIQELGKTGITLAVLNTEELVELFYGLYNPGEEEKSQIFDPNLTK